MSTDNTSQLPALHIAHYFDTEEEWDKVSNYVPEAGEIFFYKYSDYIRYKVGDGATTLGKLKLSGEANEVFLSDKITLAGNFDKIGNKKRGDSFEKGISVQKVLEDILQLELQPEIVQPSLKLTFSNNNPVEIGEYTDFPIATLDVKTGSYSYGPSPTGVEFGVGKIVLKQTDKDGTVTIKQITNGTKVDGPESSSYSLILKAKDDDATLNSQGQFLMDESVKIFYFQAVGEHSKGEDPLTNLEKKSTKDPIKAGNCSTEILATACYSYRRAFAGATVGTTIDSQTIRTDRTDTEPKTSKAEMTGVQNALEFTASGGSKKIFFAYPAIWGEGEKLKFEMFGLAWAENSNFEEIGTIEVAGARGTINGVLQNPADYKLYVWTPASSLSATSTSFRVYFES